MSGVTDRGHLLDFRFHGFAPVGNGVIGNTAVSGTVIQGSSPCSPAQSMFRERAHQTVRQGFAQGRLKVEGSAFGRSRLAPTRPVGSVLGLQGPIV